MQDPGRLCTSNIEHPTSKRSGDPPQAGPTKIRNRPLPSMFGVRCSMFDVQSLPGFDRRSPGRGGVITNGDLEGATIFTTPPSHAPPPPPRCRPTDRSCRPDNTHRSGRACPRAPSDIHPPPTSCPTRISHRRCSSVYWMSCSRRGQDISSMSIPMSCAKSQRAGSLGNSSKAPRPAR